MPQFIDQWLSSPTESLQSDQSIIALNPPHSSIKYPFVIPVSYFYPVNFLTINHFLKPFYL